MTADPGYNQTLNQHLHEAAPAGIDGRRDLNVSRAEDPLYTVSEGAAYLRTHESWLRRRIAERSIDYVKVGALVRIRKSTLDALMQPVTARPAASA